MSPEDSTIQNIDAFIQMGWISLFIVVSVTVAVTIVGGIAFWKSDNSAGTFSKLFERAQALKMITVILIVVSVTMLAFFGTVDSSGAVGILGGIAGYVLGGLEKAATEPSSDKQTEILG